MPSWRSLLRGNQVEILLKFELLFTNVFYILFIFTLSGMAKQKVMSTAVIVVWQLEENLIFFSDMLLLQLHTDAQFGFPQISTM